MTQDFQWTEVEDTGSFPVPQVYPATKEGKCGLVGSREVELNRLLKGQEFDEF